MVAVRALVYGLALAVLATVHAHAQGPVDAGVRGHVTASDGRSLAGVAVTIRAVSSDGQENNETQRSSLIEHNGSFVILNLAPGKYVISVGGTTRSIDLSAGELRDIVIEVGSARQVQAAADVLDETQGPQPLAQKEIQHLPLRRSQWSDAVRLQSWANAGVNDSVENENDADDNDVRTGLAAGRARADDGGGGSGLSFNGLPATQNAETVDGLSAEQNFGAGPRGATVGGPHAGANFAEGAVGSFRVLPRTFSAEYGGAAGGVVAVVSRGAVRAAGDRPEVHGEAFLFARQSAWAATNPFSVVTHYRDRDVTNSLVKPQDTRQQFGGSMSLSLPAKLLPPFSRNGVQMFASYEEQLREDEIVSSPALASFYALTASQVALLGKRGVSTNATNAALDYLDGLSGTTSRLARRGLGFARVDAEPSKNDHVTLAYIGNRFHSPAGAALGQASEAVVARGRGSLGDSVVQIDAGTARWLHRFSSRFNHELRTQVARDLEFETPDAPLPQEPAIGPGGFSPQVTIGPNGFAFGTTASLGRTAYPDERRVQLADLMQWAFGGHLISFGGDWSRIDDRIASFTNAEGSFRYDSGVTGGYLGGLVDWITDYSFNANAYPNGACPKGVLQQPHYFCFHTFTQSFGASQTEFVTHDIAGFAEDMWRPRSDMQISAGLRYEYTLLPPPQTPNFALDTALRGVLGAGTGLTETFPEDRNNVGPRVSFAWAPAFRKKTPLLTVRAGYGMFYGRIPGATVRAALADTALPATALSIRIRPTTTTPCPQVTNQGFGYGCDYVTTPPAAVEQTTSAMVFASKFRVPVVQRVTFEVERELGKHAWVRAGYAAALARQLPQSVDRNVAPSTALAKFVVQGGDGHPGLATGQAFTLPLYTQRLLTQYGPVTEIVSNANATYNAGTVEARWGVARMELRGSYTFSRAIDYGPQQGATPRTDGQLDPFTDGYDKGLSSLQFPQRFAGALLYDVRLARGGQALGAVVNGWRVTAIATVGSGAPYSYGIYGGTYLSGGGDSINGSGGATYLPTVGRNTLRLPMRNNLDARLGRDFHLRKNVRGEGFVEVFNLLNTVNLTRVETRAFLLGPQAVNGSTPLVFQDAATVAQNGLTTPAFGTGLSSSNGLSREREVELGVHVQF